MPTEPDLPWPSIAPIEYGELPELARALRALGSSRRSAGTLQSLFFRPLLEARRRAAAARTPAARVRSFDTAELSAALGRWTDRVASEWPDAREAARRALRARIAESTAGYEGSLRELHDAAEAALSADEAAQMERWRAWTQQLERVFRYADRGWMELKSVVDALETRRPTHPRRR